MAELKTQPTGASVEEFLAGVETEQRRKDCGVLVEMMRQVTGAPPVMWGPAIVGFGDYHYKYASGREADWFLTGFSPRKNDLTVYLMADLSRFGEILSRLGKHKHRKSCLYLKSLAAVDLDALRELVTASVRRLAKPSGDPGPTSPAG
jgi:Domain of unknown function (DU1801)